MSTPRRPLHRVFLILGIVAGIALAACGGEGGAGGAPSSAPPGRRVDSLERARDAVVRGAGVDFAQGTGIGGPAYARGLRGGAPMGAAVEELGVTYGPYLGMRCRRVGYGRCGRVGIDVVFGRAASGVEAVIGSAQTIRLRTPGQHDGIRYRDWVGTFTHPELPPRRHQQDQALVYVPIELRVKFADGRRAHALFPHVLVSSGWG